MSQLTPAEIVSQLDNHIIGQDAAKRAVAIALRNRWRRMQLEPNMRAEIAPKNIMMIGPTGVGKTEIARRLAKLSNAPFIKIEAIGRPTIIDLPITTAFFPDKSLRCFFKTYNIP